MTVGVNPVARRQKRDVYDDIDVLLKGVGIAANVYGQSIDRDKQDKLYQLQQDAAVSKKSENDLALQQKQEEIAYRRSSDEADRRLKEKEIDTKYKLGQQELALKGPEVKKANQAEQGSALYGKRMLQSNDILTSLEDRTDFNATGLGTSVQQSSFFPEIAKSKDVKSMEQAQRNFINAVLRKESGAAISPSEFEGASKQYFAQPGDTPEIIAQKRDNRALAIESMKQSAGGAWNTLTIPKTQMAAKPEAGQAVAAPARQKPLEEMSDAELAAYKKSLLGGK